VIDFSPITGIRVGSMKHLTYADAGLRLGGFDSETQAFGRTTTMGTNSDAGLGTCVTQS
jgi:hypothetical protein